MSDHGDSPAADRDPINPVHTSNRQGTVVLENELGPGDLWVAERVVQALEQQVSSGTSSRLIIAVTAVQDGRNGDLVGNHHLIVASAKVGDDRIDSFCIELESVPGRQEVGMNTDSVLTALRRLYVGGKQAAA